LPASKTSGDDAIYSTATPITEITDAVTNPSESLDDQKSIQKGDHLLRALVTVKQDF
jgi:hypothetical protein